MSTTNVESRQYGAGVAAGLAAYAIGYLVTYAWQSGGVEDALAGYNVVAELFGVAAIPAWKGVGWLFYNAHAVAFSTPALTGGRVSRNFIAAGDAPALLYLVPPLFLAAAGFVLARSADAGDAQSGASAGALVTPGYLLLAVVGLLVFQHGGDPSIHVAYATGVLLTGVLYPVAFGAFGGVLAGATN
jgi:hypothetical protein